MDVDAAGGAVTGGLIAQALEKPAGAIGARQATCTDCGAAVSRKYCAECGQPTHVHRTLLHLSEELLHGVMHFDGRLWRTLPLLVFNPGKLTREWVQGRRTSYVSPLAAFLFTIFLMFVAVSAGPGQPASPAERLAEAQTILRAAEREEAAARSALAAAPVSAAPDLQRALEQAQAEVKRRREFYEGWRQGIAEAGPKRADGLEPGSWQANLRDSALRGDAVELPFSGGLEKKIEKKLQNPDLALYKVQQAFYKFAFLLVPLSIPAVALLFAWKRGVSLYDHGVFVLYSLTFMIMLFLSAVFAARLGGWVAGMAGFAAAVGVPTHMFAQLKGAYSLTAPSALWRTLVLLLLCLLVLIAFVALILILGLAG